MVFKPQKKNTSRRFCVVIPCYPTTHLCFLSFLSFLALSCFSLPFLSFFDFLVMDLLTFLAALECRVPGSLSDSSSVSLSLLFLSVTLACFSRIILESLVGRRPSSYPYIVLQWVRIVVRSELPGCKK